MSEPIKTGDLVVVIKPTPCGCKDSLGWTGCVERLGRFKARCSFCGAVWESASMLLMSSYYIHVSRVLRIPPLEELDDVKQDEEITDERERTEAANPFPARSVGRENEGADDERGLSSRRS
jgi:hypothetical protein